MGFYLMWMPLSQTIYSLFLSCYCYVSIVMTYLGTALNHIWPFALTSIVSSEAIGGMSEIPVLRLIIFYWRFMVLSVLDVTFGSDNGMLFHSTKPIIETKTSYSHLVYWELTLVKVPLKYENIRSRTTFGNLVSKFMNILSGIESITSHFNKLMHSYVCTFTHQRSFKVLFVKYKTLKHVLNERLYKALIVS